MSIDKILEKKRDGKVLSSAEITAFIEGSVDGTVSRAQTAAFLAFVYNKGMTAEETVALTMAMVNSGDRLQWAWKGSICDKHSTGGVGDKVSLVLAPLWACLGVKVPMISGRGLGHTGGTLDKLEAIPGYRTDLGIAKLRHIFDTVGCFINGQTSQLAPADKMFYALRNEVSCVPSVPLIVSSILSKKIAEGIDTLVMDVKWGSGAFMKSREQAEVLAKALYATGTGAGLTIRSVISDMNEPLGNAVGNAIEVQEAVDCLQGKGPVDLSKLVCELIGDSRAAGILASGAAFTKWCEMVSAHGGDPSAVLSYPDCHEIVIESKLKGVVEKCDALCIGQASVALGAGRVLASHPIHHGVGIVLHAKVSDRIDVGQPLATLIHAGKGIEEAKRLVAQAYVVGAS